jgi:hypothetical protein
MSTSIASTSSTPALEHERAADAVAAEANGLGALFHRRSGVCRESAVAPSQQVFDDVFGDLAACHEQPQHVGAEELLDRWGVEGQQVAEGAVRQPATVGQQDLEMGMLAQELASGLDEADRAGDDLLAVGPVAAEDDLIRVPPSG